jgi:hypothetical protein
MRAAAPSPAGSIASQRSASREPRRPPPARGALQACGRRGAYGAGSSAHHDLDQVRAELTQVGGKSFGGSLLKRPAAPVHPSESRATSVAAVATLRHGSLPSNIAQTMTRRQKFYWVIGNRKNSLQWLYCGTGGKAHPFRVGGLLEVRHPDFPLNLHG